MLPDPFRLSIALVPLAAYCVLLGLINARRRPFVTTGGCDLAALGAAMSGLVLVGPIELFRPEAAEPNYGGFVWLFLIVFYWLCVWLAVLVARPRLVVYNIRGEELRPALAEAARRLDPARPLGRRQPGAAEPGRVAPHRMLRDHAALLAHLQRRQAEHGGLGSALRRTAHPAGRRSASRPTREPSA